MAQVEIDPFLVDIVGSQLVGRIKQKIKPWKVKKNSVVFCSGTTRSMCFLNQHQFNKFTEFGKETSPIFFWINDV